MSTSVSSKTSNEELQKLNQTSRYQQLKSKKESLEKTLNAKYELLHQICQQEALLIGNIDLIPFSSNIQFIQQQSPSHQNVNRQSSLLSNIKLPDQVHSNQHNQSQIMLQRVDKDHNSYVNSTKSVDDINIHRRIKDTLPMVGNNSKNLYLLNNNSSLNSERRNSMRSTSSHGSSNTFIVQASPSSASSMTSLKTLNTHQSGVLSVNHNEIETYEYDYRLRNESPLSLLRSTNQYPQNSLIPQNKNIYMNNINVNTESNLHINGRDYSNQFSPSHYHQFFQQPSSPCRTIENKPISRKASYHQQNSYESYTKQKNKDKFMEDSRSKQLQRAQTMSGHHNSPNHYTPAHSQGLGGYWTINDHNQRIWVSDNNKFPISPVHQPAIKMSKKSNSLGNFDLIYKQDQDHQNFVENNIQTNEQQKKKNTWCETSLDDVGGEPIIENRKNRLDQENNNSNSNNQRMFDNFQPINKGSLKLQQENIYLNPLANNITLTTPPTIPPKSKLRHTESTKSITDSENNVVPYISSLQIDSPNSSKFTVIQEGSWKPYKEEVKSYEISDFYKYSLKYRQQQEEQQNK